MRSMHPDLALFMAFTTCIVSVIYSSTCLHVFSIKCRMGSGLCTDLDRQEGYPIKYAYYVML